MKDEWTAQYQQEPIQAIDCNDVRISVLQKMNKGKSEIIICTFVRFIEKGANIT